MNTCENYAALLDLYVDGELGAEELTAVQAHLDECPACRAYVDDALAIRAAFPEAEETELPEGFHESVMASVAADAAKAKKKARSKVWNTLMPLAACFAVVLMVGRSGVMGFKSSGAETSAAMAPAAAPEVYDAAGQTAEAPAAAAAEPKSKMEYTGSAAASCKPAVEEQYSMTTASDGTQARLGALNQAQTRGYFAVLHVGSEAETLDALAGREPVTLEDGTVGYELDRAEYEAFIAELSALESPLSIAEDSHIDPDADTALVILESK